MTEKERTGPHHEAGPTITIRSIPPSRFTAAELRAQVVVKNRQALDDLLAPKPCCTCCCAPSEQVSDLSDVDLYHLGGLDLTWAEREAAGRDLVGAWSA